jgi:hypothetical protein
MRTEGVVSTSSCDTFTPCLVIGDKLVEYEVYEGLAPIILFSDMSTSRGGAELWSFGDGSGLSGSKSLIEGRGGRSGYPISSGRVIRVLNNSSNENHYPISAP